MRASFIAVAALALASSANAEVVYQNNAVGPSNLLFTAGTEIADDVHMTMGGQLSSFSFQYQGIAATSATVRFYPNDAANSINPVPANLIAEFTGISLPGGGATGIKTVPVVGGPALPADVWMSVEFIGANGGMRQANAASIGWSSTSQFAFPQFDGQRGNYGFNVPLTVEVLPTPGAGALLAIAGLGLTRRRR